MKFLPLTLFILLSLASIAGGADFTVTTTTNGGAGSLRQAILDANATPNAGGQDRIIFNIPGPGVHVIDISSGELPGITDPVIIDGYTQPGARPNTLAVGSDAIILIHIDNTQDNRFIGTGLLITGGTSIVRGLSITGFNTAGISLEGPGAANIIEGNFIGLKPDGQTVAKVNVGIEVATPGNMIGGTSPGARNVVAGGGGGTIHLGIWVTKQPNTVSGNYIGTDASGTVPLGHQVGVRVEGGNGGVVIGGTSPGAGNLISGDFVGIQVGYRTAFRGVVYEVSANGVEITGNVIGLASDGKTPLGQPEVGVFIVASGNTSVGGLTPGAGNVIAFSDGAGVSVAGSSLGGFKANNNRILSNSIYGRGGRRIDFGEFPNDPMDTDEGVNRRQNFPIVTRTLMSGGTLLIEGTLNSAPNTQFTIQLFSDSYDVLQRGQAFLGTTTATTNNNGDATFFASIPSQFGPSNVNATATDPAGNTSEFFLRPSRFRNLSTRARTQPGDAALIGGFITPGAASARFIVRAVGPSLISGGVPVADRLEDPTLEIYSGGRLIGSNDNWRDDPAMAAEVEKHGLAPAHELEPAAVIYPGNIDGYYTAVVRGKNNASGIALVEVYDVTGTTHRRLANMSTRGLVQPGDNVMIGGFILLDGHGPTHIVARAIGPSLSNAGIANPLADPTLELRNSNGTLLASNDNWQEEQEAELSAISLAPTNPAEAAILALLDPGTYTAIVRGKDGSTGIALVEFYQLP